MAILFETVRDYTSEEIRYSLAGWNPPDATDSTFGLIEAIMVLCNRVAELEYQIKATKQKNAVFGK